MPSCYAHYRFGTHLLPMLPREIRQLVDRHRSLFDMGLHGPDPFTYYAPGLKNRIEPLSDQFHAQSGAVFFARVCRRCRMEPSEPALAYLYGLLAHYCLDTLCHPFVYQHTRDGALSHMALETEFDRYLLEKDGRLPPHTQDCSDHIRLTPAECEVIAGFYPQVTGAVIAQCARNMALSTRLLAGSNPLYRKAMIAVLGLTGQYSQMVRTEGPDPRCAHLDGELDGLFEEALALYPRLLAQLTDHLRHGAPLGEDFAPAFDIYEKKESNIP